MKLSTLAAFANLSHVPVLGGFIPSPTGQTVISSELFPGAEISYKKTSICETTEGVNSYAGYVTLPKNLLLPDSQGWNDSSSGHFFFWYFESRNDPSTDPTTIYLGGGPGTTSFDGMSNFPCNVNRDSNSTTLNKYSWNSNSNMLYIDQPLGTAFSYVELVNGTLDLLSLAFNPVESVEELPELNVTMRQATLDHTMIQTDRAINTTAASARTLWKFAQVWFNEFPEWTTENKAISLWTVSYGGFYGPAFFDYSQDQNELIESGCHPLANATTLQLATLGLSDACVDVRAMAKGYPNTAYNNTCGIQVYSKQIYEQTMDNVTDPETGCYALIDQCRQLALLSDPQGLGTNATVNEACGLASQVCFGLVQGAFTTYSDRAAFDLTQSNLTDFPPEYRTAFFNQPWVQEELGVPLNFTASSDVIVAAFFGVTGDPMLRSISTLEKVMAGGVNVALVYGDRDYRCNWFGGENVSLSLDFKHADSFRAAGYADIHTNTSYNGGLVRQHGSLSFSRIYQAGHGVAAYQPETLYHVFQRALAKRDIATGKIDLSRHTNYTSVGPTDVKRVKNKVPEMAESICYVYKASLTCTEEQLAALADGSAVVEDWIVTKPAGLGQEEVTEASV